MAKPVADVADIAAALTEAAAVAVTEERGTGRAFDRTPPGMDARAIDAGQPDVLAASSSSAGSQCPPRVGSIDEAILEDEHAAEEEEIEDGQEQADAKGEDDAASGAHGGYRFAHRYFLRSPEERHRIWGEFPIGAD